MPRPTICRRLAVFATALSATGVIGVISGPSTASAQGYNPPKPPSYETYTRTAEGNAWTFTAHLAGCDTATFFAQTCHWKMILQARGSAPEGLTIHWKVTYSARDLKAEAEVARARGGLFPSYPEIYRETVVQSGIWAPDTSGGSATLARNGTAHLPALNSGMRLQVDVFVRDADGNPVRFRWPTGDNILWLPFAEYPVGEYTQSGHNNPRPFPEIPEITRP